MASPIVSFAGIIKRRNISKYSHRRFVNDDTLAQSRRPPSSRQYTTRPVRRSGGVSMRTTTMQSRHSMRRRLHAFIRPTVCKYDVIHKPEVHNVSQSRLMGNDQPRPEVTRKENLVNFGVCGMRPDRQTHMWPYMYSSMRAHPVQTRRNQGIT